MDPASPCRGEEDWCRMVVLLLEAEAVLVFWSIRWMGNLVRIMVDRCLLLVRVCVFFNTMLILVENVLIISSIGS